jgi:hypothetical protein
MSVNYEISDVFNYTFTGTTTATTIAANASSGLLYRDAANSDEVRLLLVSGTTNQVLTTTASNQFGWSDPQNIGENTEFLVTPASAQTISSSALSSFTTVVWGTETLDPGTNFAANVYTIPTTATYFFSVILEWGTTNKTNKGERHARIAEDPGGLTPVSLVLVKEQPNSNKTISYYQRASIIYSGTAAETIGVQVSQDSGANQDIDTESQFFGWRII